jgi:hypothetical protein
MKKINSKVIRINIIRIAISMTLPFWAVIVFYSFLSGLYHEPLFGLGLIFSFPNLYVTILPVLICYTLVMEILGRKIIQTSYHNSLHSFVFLLTGSGIGMLYLLISDNRTSFEWYLVIFITGLSVSLIKLLLHLKEKFYEYN